MKLLCNKIFMVITFNDLRKYKNYMYLQHYIYQPNYDKQIKLLNMCDHYNKAVNYVNSLKDNEGKWLAIVFTHKYIYMPVIDWTELDIYKYNGSNYVKQCHIDNDNMIFEPDNVLEQDTSIKYKE